MVTQLQTGQPGYLGSRSAPIHSHPAFNHLLGFIPTDIKRLFDLLFHIYYRAPQISQVLQRKSSYTVTRVVVDSDMEQERTDWEHILEQIGVRQVLKTRAIDRFVYGSSFHYVYRPFVRFLRCPACRTETRMGERYVDCKFDHTRGLLSYGCPSCKSNVSVSLFPSADGQPDNVRDSLVATLSRIKVRRLDPRNVSLEFNEYAGTRRYWYDPPAKMRQSVLGGDVWYLSELPRSLIEAVCKGTWYQFDTDAVYHSRVDGPISPYEGWGLPPMLFVLPDIYHVLVLKRANEAIGMEYIAPFRVVTPSVSNASGLPTAQVVNLAGWQEQFLEALAMWRKDPLHLTSLSAPVEVTQVGGQGRALLVGQEIKEAEGNVLAGMGWPPELYFGGSGAVSPPLLRTMENELINDQQDDELFLRWIAGQVAMILARPTIPKLSLAPFKLLDDIPAKGLLAQIHQSVGLVSKSTLGELMDVDYADEQLRMCEDAEMEAKTQETIARVQAQSQARIQASQAAEQAAAMQQQDVGSPEALAAAKGMIMQQAQMLAQELSQLDPESRRSRLASEEEDPVTYALAKQLMANLDRERDYANTQTPA